MTNPLTPKKNLENELHPVEKARVLIRAAESNLLHLGMVMVEIKAKELWRDYGYKDWVEFYRIELGRDKSSVTKLLTDGEVLIEAGCSPTTLPDVGLETLYKSAVRHKGKDAKFVIAEALTWTLDDYATQKKEDCKEHDWGVFCRNAWHEHEDSKKMTATLNEKHP